MPALEPLCCWIGISPAKLTKENSIILEAELFSRICNELKDVLRKHYLPYFRILKFSMLEENEMLDANFICLLVKDILASGEYTPSGIAYYTNTPEDVITEVAAGCNPNPSAIFLQRIIEMHRTVRRELYTEVIKKITSEYLTVA